MCTSENRYRHDLNLNARVPGSNTANNGTSVYIYLHLPCTIIFVDLFVLSLFLTVLGLRGCIGAFLWLRRAGAAPQLGVRFPWQRRLLLHRLWRAGFTSAVACGLRVAFAGSQSAGPIAVAHGAPIAPGMWVSQIQDRDLRRLLRQVDF